MHAVTIRRLIVFGVCAVGVAALYVAPAASRSPHAGTPPQSRERPVASPGVSTTSRPRSDATARRTSGPTRERPEESASTRDPHPATTRDSSAERPAPRSTTSPGATAFDPNSVDDAQPPAPVSTVTSAAVTPDRLTLRWPAASDNVGVTTYQVLLNGYEVASTPDTHATIRWFNDDASEHVVQVRALDAAGNQSAVSPALLVARPTPEPVPSGSPTPPTDPEPTTSPTPQPTPDASTEAPGGEGLQEDRPHRGEEPPMPEQQASLSPSAPAATGR